MKDVSFLWIATAVSGLIGLLLLAPFPLLRLISPRAPQRVEVSGGEVASFIELEVARERGKIRYQLSGSPTDAEGVLFLHGFNSQLSTWDGVWARLRDCGKIVRMDIAGYGGSTWATDDYTLPAQARRVIAFMDAIGLRRVTLVGASMGGSLCAWIAAHYPDRVQGVVLAAPSGFPGSLQNSGLFGKLLKPGVANHLVRFVAGSRIFRALYPDSVALQALSVTSSYGAPWAEALPHIQAQTWVLWSRGDRGVPFSFAEAVSRAIPRSTLLPISPEAAHEIPSARPELIAELARRLHHGERAEQTLAELRAALVKRGDG